MTTRAQYLRVEVTDGRLVMSIGVDTLADVVRGCDAWHDELGWKLASADRLADDICLQLSSTQWGQAGLLGAIIEGGLMAIDDGTTAIDYGQAD